MDREEMILKLRKIHGNDEEQIKFILSEEKRLIITASAGCGKTTAMISKIAYELISTPSLNYKKILALTFSVNASTMIKEDTARILPELLDDDKFNLDKKLDVSNYHSFSMKLLYKHGYGLNENLKNIEDFVIVSDQDRLLDDYLITSEAKILSEFSQAVNDVDIDTVDRLFEKYKNILINKLIQNNIITYNGLLVMGDELLKTQSIKNFYKLYYPIIIVDEFQDTNYLSYKIITNLIDTENKVILMGDDIQKIYGFLGAMPNLFSHMESKYNMMAMEFNTNYRFKDNHKMMQLDKYIRQIFKQYDNMDRFDKTAEINFGFYKTENQEANKIKEGMKNKIYEGADVALLVNIKSSATKVIECLEAEGIQYFNGLFLDTDVVYKKFHNIALEKFVAESGTCKSVSQRVLDRVIAEIELCQTSITDDIIIFNSLMVLLKALFDKVKNSNLIKEDKYNKIIFVLHNNSLKRLMNEVDEKIVITTIHGSKGLEWDYVYIPQITESQFPVYPALCKHCKNGGFGIQYQYYCEFTFPNELRSEFEKQLSIYYVAITRAKKDVFLFANVEKNRYGYVKRGSCFISLPNLKHNKNF